MKIELRLYAQLRSYQPVDDNAPLYLIDVDPGTTIHNLLSKLDIPRHMAMIILINGTRARLNQQLKEGDCVAVFPPIAGG